jgi:alpha-glucosidase
LGGDEIDWRPAQPDRWRMLESVNDARSASLPAYAAKIMQKIA